MPYKEIKELPASIKKVLPEAGQNIFLKTFNEVFKKNRDEDLAFSTAWKIVKGKFKKVDTGWVAMSQDFVEPSIYVFDLKEPEVKVVMNNESEEVILEAILANNELNTEGKFFELEDLEFLARQINEEGSTLPDIDHAHYDSLKNEFGATLVANPDIIKSELKKRKGEFKKIKATVTDGKLWIQAQLDKRYKSSIKNFTGLSIEALAKSNPSGRLERPKYLGFTFTNRPKLINAKIVS